MAYATYSEALAALKLLNMGGGHMFAIYQVGSWFVIDRTNPPPRLSD